MRTQSPDMVGRVDELRRINEALASARSGHGDAVFLTGESGIGKTRLAAAAIDAAARKGMVSMRGRASVVGPMVPYRPLTEALMSFVRTAPLLDVTALGPYRSVLGRLIPEWRTGDTPGLNAGSTVVIGEAVLRLLALAGDPGGALIVLDDLQFADAETLAVAEYLLDNISDVPVVLVAAVRDEGAAQIELGRAAERRGVAEVLHLPPLTVDEIRQVAASCLGVAIHEVPEETAKRLWRVSAGNPFFAAEMLYATEQEGLVFDGDDHKVVGELQLVLPDAVFRSLTRRIDLLGDQSRAVLTVAAVFGQRFCLPVVRCAAGVDEGTVLGVMRGGVSAELLEPDEPAPDWYTFHHPLMVDSLLATLTPTEDADLARRVADAVEELNSELTGDWCALVASLRERSGNADRAGHLFATAGRRALAEGATRSAAALLLRAQSLLDANTDPQHHADVVEELLAALAETGQFDDAAALAGVIDQLRAAGLPPGRCAAIHAQLANAAQMAGLWDTALDELTLARELLGDRPADADVAPVDAIAAHLAVHQSGPDRLVTAKRLAQAAADAAERAGLPAVACDAWQLLGVLAREDDLEAASAYFRRARDHADQHQLPVQRAYSEVLEAGVACVMTGGLDELRKAHEQALDIGVIPLAYEVEGIIALHNVLRGDYATARRDLDSCLAVATRLKGRAVPYLLVTKAVLAAHQADRTEMELALARLAAWGSQTGQELPMAYGLARTFCALLEGQHPLAEREQASALAFDVENPSTLCLSGRDGLSVLMSVCARRAGWPHLTALRRTSALDMRWNSQFVLLAEAVLLGREGRQAEATARAVAAQAASVIYPMARHLSLRMVAEFAHQDGWGEPENWLRQGEEYFHDRELPAMVRSCRASLRAIGASVRQRRDGIDRVPEFLRRLGVTAREWEVGELLALGLANKAIAGRLHISPRTVEKHVSNLIMKSGAEGRDAFGDMVRSWSATLAVAPPAR